MTKGMVKEIVEKVCLNEYRSKSERGVKIEMTGALKGVLTLDTHISLLAQIELLNKRLD